MKIIKLKDSEVLLLSQTCKSGLTHYLQENKLNKKLGETTFMLNSNQLHQIVEFLTNAFVEKGVNSSGEINELGMQIEELIDKFNDLD